LFVGNTNKKKFIFCKGCKGFLLKSIKALYKVTENNSKTAKSWLVIPLAQVYFFDGSKPRFFQKPKALSSDKIKQL